MRLLRCLPLMLLSLPALAETPIDARLGSVGGVEIGGIETVPLLSMRSNPAVPVVSAVVNGKTDKPGALFALSTGSAVITVNDAFLATHGLEARTHKDKRVGELQVVQIDSLQIGGLLLKDVTAMVSSSEVDKAGVGGFAPMQIGLGALKDLSYAIVPSAGEVRFAPAGAALLDAIGGERIAYQVPPSAQVKVGKNKQRQPDSYLLVNAKAGGLTVPVSLNSAAPDNHLQVATDRSSLTAALGEVGTHQRGDVVLQWVDVAVGPASDVGWVASTTAPDLSALDLLPSSHLGAPWLSGFDLAVNPATGNLVLASAPTQKRVDALPGTVESLEKQAAEADTKAAEAAKESGEPAKPDAAAWSAVADIYEQAGRWDDALATWAKVVEADPTACEAQRRLGEARFRTGDLAGAAAALQQASSLYQAWWGDDVIVPGAATGEGHPAATPGKLRPQYSQVPHKNRKGQWIPALARQHWEAAKKKGKTLPEGVVVQPLSCWTADSALAQVRLAEGKPAEALAIYEGWVARFPPMRMVLDPTLATVSANAHLSQGDWAASHDQLRQAAAFDLTKADPRWALGLALAYANQGRFDSAEPLFLQALDRDLGDTLAVQLYLDAVRAQADDKAMWVAARRWADARPDSPGALFGLAYAATVAGMDRQVATVQAEADKAFTRLLNRAPFDADLLAAQARTLAALGDKAAAKAPAEQALKLQPGSAAAMLASADAAMVAEKAASMVKKAAQAAPDHPGYALLLTAAPKAPAAPPVPTEPVEKGE